MSVQYQALLAAREQACLNALQASQPLADSTSQHGAQLLMLLLGAECHKDMLASGNVSVQATLAAA